MTLFLIKPSQQDGLTIDEAEFISCMIVNIKHETTVFGMTPTLARNFLCCYKTTALRNKDLKVLDDLKHLEDAHDIHIMADVPEHSFAGGSIMSDVSDEEELKAMKKHFDDITAREQSNLC
jgi:hypothetical protein